ncbi:MAG: hypothetical protein IPM53_22020 [Anaerolineaceae bacterium]|nr:hypothetical protein [Anaerolineaceae bacterium]
MNRKNLLYLLLLSLSLTSCFRATTPPGPNMAGGGYENVKYDYFDWQEGLNVMIWHEGVTTSGCNSSGSTSSDTHLVQCQATTQSGIEYTWEVATKDGRSAEFTLDGQPYDLADGNLFLITLTNGILDVQQLQRDLSDVDTTHDSITQFGLADPDIRHFIETAAPAN